MYLFHWHTCNTLVFIHASLFSKHEYCVSTHRISSSSFMICACGSARLPLLLCSGSTSVAPCGTVTTQKNHRSCAERPSRRGLPAHTLKLSCEKREAGDSQTLTLSLTLRPRQRDARKPVPRRRAYAACNTHVVDATHVKATRAVEPPPSHPTPMSYRSQTTTSSTLSTGLQQT